MVRTFHSPDPQLGRQRYCFRNPTGILAGAKLFLAFGSRHFEMRAFWKAKESNHEVASPRPQSVDDFLGRAASAKPDPYRRRNSKTRTYEGNMKEFSFVNRGKHITRRVPSRMLRDLSFEQHYRLHCSNKWQRFFFTAWHTFTFRLQGNGKSSLWIRK